MNQEKFDRVVKAINQYEGVEEVFLLSPEGEILFKSNEFPLTETEAKELLVSWKEKKPSISYQGVRFAILKNDDIQLAAKNITSGQGNLAGSITNEGDYLVIHTASETGLILLEWSIFVNKVAWDQLD
ncbi:MAG: hypothetical protein GF317_06255 [Candidatus Lokiarchaeota archaeon]|nr:hypothetical protein [Candidatus Lokiarchaeota archaeon]MBD3199324.1 hypothetical protein [Candidatus Lokiarchaeota archaeon]